MFTYRERVYDYKFSLKRLELIENQMGGSIMDIMFKTNGMFSIAQMQAFYMFGVKEEGADAFVSAKTGLEIFAEHY